MFGRLLGFGKKEPEERRRSSLEVMGRKSQLSEEELQDLHDISEREREMATIRPDGAARLRRLRQRPKRRRNRSRRRTPTNLTKRKTSLKSLKGQDGKFHDYLGDSEDDSDLRPRDDDGNLIQPPSPPPTVGMLIDDLNKKKYIRGGKTRKRRRKRRRKTKRKGRRKTKKRRKRRKRKTRRKR